MLAAPYAACVQVSAVSLAGTQISPVSDCGTHVSAVISFGCHFLTAAAFNIHEIWESALARRRRSSPAVISEFTNTLADALAVVAAVALTDAATEITISTSLTLKTLHVALEDKDKEALATAESCVDAEVNAVAAMLADASRG
jgi:hypothetical protein